MTRRLSKISKTAVFSALLAATSMAGAVAAQAEDKLKVFVSFGYYGNTWMEQNANMMTALANSADYKDKVDFEVQIVGDGDAQRQSQQINAMIEAGADIILLYPVSPTAVNRAIRNACKAGVMVVSWDSTVDEECATNVAADNTKQAIAESEWVANRIGGEGNVVMINGVPGFAANETRITAAKGFWAENYPGINVAGEIDGMWSDPIVRDGLTKWLAVNTWDDVDVGWAQLGCYPFYALQEEAGIPDAEKKPCAGSAENAEILALLPSDTEVEGATASYRPMGIDGYTFTIGPIMGAKAMWYAMNARLAGEKLPHFVEMAVPEITQANVKLCSEGTWEEMNGGCNVFPPSVLPNPEASVGVYDPELPQVALKAAMEGIPEY